MTRIGPLVAACVCLACASGPSDAPAAVPSSERLDAVRTTHAESLRSDVEGSGFRWGAPVFLRVFKESSELELWMDQGAEFELFRTFPICAWSGELGPKTKEGDRQCPEGFYRILPSQLNPNSQYHLSFNLGYPNDLERRFGWTGSALMVHGDCLSIGCYAMTDPAIEIIYLLVEAALTAGQAAVPVHAFPFRMTHPRVRETEGQPWYGFWRLQLLAGYEAFEATKRPPRMGTADGRYNILDEQLVPELVRVALARTELNVTYDGAYRTLAYPGGDVPDSIGVCTDLIVRSYRALGIDLQRRVHEDMKVAFGEYPRDWGLSAPDSNIDHRRVPNLERFFARRNASIEVSDRAADYLPGDLVTWRLDGRLPHIGIVSTERSASGVPMIVHNIGRGPEQSDCLFEFPITGHYRYRPTE